MKQKNKKEEIDLEEQTILEEGDYVPKVRPKERYNMGLTVLLIFCRFVKHLLHRQ